MQVTVETRTAADRCALCHDALGEARSVRCLRCGTRAHGTCCRELGRGCPTLGCPGRLVAPREVVAPAPAKTAEPQLASRLHSLTAGFFIGIASGAVAIGALVLFAMLLK